MSSTHRLHDIGAVVRAHGALTESVVRASQLMTIHGHTRFAAHLDDHRGELNVAIGEFALWAESFGDWARIDASHAIHPSGNTEACTRAGSIRFQRDPARDLFLARQRLKSRRTGVLSALGDARVILRAARLPVDELTAYRRVVRLWAGEAIDLVTAVHRLTLADQYIRGLDDLRADPDHHGSAHRRAVTLLRQWMTELEQADREDELALARTCGYGDFVDGYCAEALP